MASGSDYVKRLDAVDFPAAPEVVMRLSGLLSEEWVTAEQLSEVVALDAGISARAMAEAAVRDGFEVVALDLFGTFFPRGHLGDFSIAEDASIRVVLAMA